MSTRIVERPGVRRKSNVRSVPKAQPAGWTVLLLLSDVLFFAIASALGSLIGFHRWDQPRNTQHFLIAEVVYVGLWVLIFARLGLYGRLYALTIKDELYYTIAALGLGTIPQLILFTIYPEISTSRVALLCSLAFSIVLVGGSRAAFHALRSHSRFASTRRTAVVGTPERVAAALESLDLPEDSATLVVTVDDIDDTINDIDLRRDRDLTRIDWFHRARSWGCEVLILTEILPPNVVTHLLEVSARDHIQFAFAPPRITRFAYSLSLASDGRQALIVPARLRACTPRAQLFKRIMDVTLACVALVLFSPVMIAAAIAVYFDSGFPIFYAQDRVGLGGRVFSILKFRSMRIDAEREVGAVWASAADPRKTRIGGFLRRFSIDELPQLLNVLRGDMSLVGPRPERPVFVDLFRKTLSRYEERNLIRPGITGWSQVHMQRVLEPSAAAEKLEYDLQYLENWSPFLDLSVLFQTLFEFLFHRAA
ncbi:MAG TPA: sugar transferase [Candidatus Baltobacteraceae bacterium]|nr:sugar transferase [Candidatus Baltobacteraceae bacterium]